MKFLIPFLIISSSLFSQQPKIRIIGETKIADSIVLQTAELMIFNNTGHTICIRVSIQFAAKVLGRDTIQFGSLNAGDDCTWYNLWVTKQDIERSDYEVPRYPLVLNNRTCFAATISIIRDLRCKNFGIEFSYIDQEGVNYNEFLNKYEKHQSWDRDAKLKYLTGKIYL